MTRPLPRQAVVFGGAGFIGTHLVRHLVSQGCKVVVADIAQPQFPLPAGVRVEHVDVRKPMSFAVDTPDVVFNLAAVHRTPGHPAGEYYDTNIAGALNVTKWCEDMGVERLVFTSSISVYGPTEESKDENSPLTPNSSYGRSKLLAERVHSEWRLRGRRQLVIVRPAVVFGPGEQGNFSRLADALRRRRFVYPGRDDTVKACGYVSDLIRALLFGLAQNRDMLAFNYCYPRRYTIREICQAFEEVAGYTPPRRIPGPVMIAAVRGLSLIPGGGRTGALNPERIRKVTASTNIVPSVLVDSGFTWETDLVTALRRWRDEEPVGRFL
jgi:nucleoside-diphosphate-sugar epimerase